MFDPRHVGLYFSEAQAARARDSRDGEPLRSAWQALLQRRPTTAIGQVQGNALLYRLGGDQEAGRRALDEFGAAARSSEKSVGHFAHFTALLTLAQCHELLHDHPSFTWRGAWLKEFAGRVHTGLTLEDNLLHVESVWQNLLRLASAIVLEDEGQFGRACDLFRNSVRGDLHFDGYIRKSATGQGGGSLGRMLLTAQALALCAEAATHAGEPLWEFDVRGVSALTPTPYLLYYFWYPEKWRWDGEIDGDAIPQEGDGAPLAEEARALYRRHAGLWELAQARSPSPDRQLLLDELRPVFDERGGGPLTLTHAAVKDAPKRRRLFGRVRF